MMQQSALPSASSVLNPHFRMTSQASSCSEFLRLGGTPDEVKDIFFVVETFLRCDLNAFELRDENGNYGKHPSFWYLVCAVIIRIPSGHDGCRSLYKLWDQWQHTVLLTDGLAISAAKQFTASPQNRWEINEWMTSMSKRMTMTVMQARLYSFGLLCLITAVGQMLATHSKTKPCDFEPSETLQQGRRSQSHTFAYALNYLCILDSQKPSNSTVQLD